MNRAAIPTDSVKANVPSFIGRDFSFGQAMSQEDTFGHVGHECVCDLRSELLEKSFRPPGQKFSHNARWWHLATSLGLRVRILQVGENFRRRKLNFEVASRLTKLISHGLALSAGESPFDWNPAWAKPLGPAEANRISTEPKGGIHSRAAAPTRVALPPWVSPGGTGDRRSSSWNPPLPLLRPCGGCNKTGW